MRSWNGVGGHSLSSVGVDVHGKTRVGVGVCTREGNLNEIISGDDYSISYTHQFSGRGSDASSSSNLQFNKYTFLQERIQYAPVSGHILQ